MSSFTPRIEYPAELPVVEHLDRLREAISQHQVVVIAGETGSGKTTQIPKLCLELGRGSEGKIAHTQPRRLAARSVAARLAQELDTPLGEGVGYQIRFQDHSSDNTRIKLMTDGVLLAAIQQDRELRAYDTIIIDEAHERSLNIDFLLGYLRQLLPRRPELKLIITSATIDQQRFAEHFDQAPVIEVEGRTYPVEMRYRPPEDEGEAMPEAIAGALQELYREGASRRGDVLVFLSGEREIREVAKELRTADLPATEVLPLYGRLSNAEQNRIFDLSSRRGWRVVLATNVAETSLTVPGIHFVIDTGLARISRYSYRSKVQRLPIEAISQASANQRAGRCGRLAPGVCVRLYSEADYLARPEYTEPEIQRSNLASVILQMLQLRLGRVEDFPFVDPPDQRLVNDGYKLLQELAAVELVDARSSRRKRRGQEQSKDQKQDRNQNQAAAESTGNARQGLSAIGRQIARFPLDPRLARMLLAAAEQGCLREVAIIVSALSVQDPRERPSEKQQSADDKHRRFWQEGSDFLAWVALWDYWETQRQELSGNQLRKQAKRDYLAFMRMREWRDVHHQISVQCRQQKLRFNTEPAAYQSVHKALLTGLLGNIAQHQERGEYLGARNRKLRVFPGSSQFKKANKWIVAAELSETTQLYARGVAKIEPDWALGINDELIKRSHYEVHWQARTGRVMAYERQSLYGLMLRDKVKVHYGPINRVEAREVLIRQGLVEGNYRGKAAFYTHNSDLISEVENLEDKARKRGIKVSDEVLFRYYDERLPADITTARGLDSWYRKAAEKAPELLRLNRSDVVTDLAAQFDGAQLPDNISWQSREYPLHYHFEPGHKADGVSVDIPLGLLANAPAARFEWLVPGFLHDKCVNLVKALPKALRKQLVPVPDKVAQALQHMQPSDDSLLEALAEGLRKTAGVRISATDWDSKSLDPFYRMNFRVLDAKGKPLAQGRDLAHLQTRFADKAKASLAEEQAPQLEVQRARHWDFGELASEHKFTQGGVAITAYPALVDCGGEVAVELLHSAEEAAESSRQGLRRLLLNRLGPQAKKLQSAAFASNQQQLQFAATGQSREQWCRGLMSIAVDQVFLADELGRAVLPEQDRQTQQGPRSAEAFEACYRQGLPQLDAVLQQYTEVLEQILQSWAAIRKALKGYQELSWFEQVSDIQQQLSGLFVDDFLLRIEPQRLQQYPRYLSALLQRLEKMRGNYQKDRQATLSLAGFQAKLADQLGSADMPTDVALNDYRWMLEEWRVSLFAQGLGTAYPVSEKRLKAAWQLVLEARAAAV